MLKKILLLLLLFNSFIIRSQNENFNTFIAKFSQDSTFQLSRVQFPLTYVSWNYQEDKEFSIVIKQEKYKLSNLYFSLMNHGEAYTVFFDNFDCKFRDTGEMVFCWKGFTDMDVRYYFKRLEGKWFLVKILNYDPLE